MFLKQIKLVNFRNHAESNFRFNNKITCVVGNNGVGKTNLLDAIYYLCLTKSYLYPDDKLNVRYGCDFFRLEGTFNHNDEILHVVCKYVSGRKKEFSCNNTIYVKLSDHIGRIPCIMICPADGEIITGGSEERRKAIDITLSQTDTNYLNALMQYNKILAQRNAALKNYVESGKKDFSLIEIYSNQLIAPSNYIYQKRKEVFTGLSEIFKETYYSISGSSERVNIDYKSQLHDSDLQSLLIRNRQKDIELQRTESGIHKDDFDMMLENYPVKRFGSQGQQKSFLLAFKLSLYHYISVEKSIKPILLVDDVFDKLDKQRSQRLIDYFSNDRMGQIFLTHTKGEDFIHHSAAELIAI
ncbi:MAG: DNA replication and repair protein RecF [Chitinophagales bacterium]|nr:DNA replication and repair protein RecF [Chitinophagales bacterium]MDW8273137.1 DNA replication and repair protein RecF [Chitinophagales bacterium]